MAAFAAVAKTALHRTTAGFAARAPLEQRIKAGGVVVLALGRQLLLTLFLR